MSVQVHKVVDMFGVSDNGQHFSMLGTGDWNTWVYGPRLCNASSIENEDLVKLKQLFVTIWAHVCD
jgi:hypothetical protein